MKKLEVQYVSIENLTESDPHVVEDFLKSWSREVGGPFDIGVFGTGMSE
jgi:hypothetical protein